MLPGGSVAALFLLSLVPGWWFLRRTESSRRPRHLSALQELLELLGVGVSTTGLAVGTGLLLFPELLLERRFPAETAREVRTYVVLILGLLVIAIALAELSARWVRWRSPAQSAEFSIGTWWSVMRPDLVPEGRLPYVAVERSDGMTVEGILHNYTLSADAAHRDIALKKPIRFTSPASVETWGRASPSETKSVPFEFVIVPADEIKHIALSFPKR